MRWLAALLALSPLACKEEESACNEVEAVCAACADVEAQTTCEALLQRRDQVDCSLALEDLVLVCGDGGLPPEARDAAVSSVDSGL
jgi:hypothetical protein